MELPIIIIGTGSAGIAAARAIRKIDAQKTVLIISDNSGYTYSKPKLSFMCSQSFNEDCLNIKSREFLERSLSCKIIPDCNITHIDTELSTLLVDGLRKIQYSALIIATGATAKKSNAAKSTDAVIHSCNSLVEYRQIVSSIKRARTIAIVGGGLVGCEIAYDLSTRFNDVHLICNRDRVLDGNIDNESSKEIENRLTENQVNIHKKSYLQSYTKTDDKICLRAEGKAKQLTIRADLIIETIGLVPNIPFITKTKIVQQNGISVNRYLRTNITNIYALGDCASLEGRNISNIKFINDCAKVIANNLLSDPTSLNDSSYNLFVKVGQPIIKTQFTI